jgi:general secretion pathway protein C
VNSNSLYNNFATVVTQPTVLIPATLLVVGACLFNTYQRLSPPTFDHIQATETAADPITESMLGSHDIVALNLFGTAQTSTKPEQNHQDIPETNLRLSLKGAFTHSVPEKASALIAPDVNSKAELFFIDASLPGGAVLDTVYPDHVIIRRNGQLEKLQFLRSLPNQSSGSNPSAYDSYEPPIQSPYVQPQQDQNRSLQYKTGPNTSSDNSSTNNSSLAEIRERIRQRSQQ